ncbi:hypothetical protein [Microbacterium immunditiarum]|uniref:Uncharacterized protein n=1 Tax=Microbacterium immunditiarum TaxID=337480 RepID=A0A7Y9GMH7_9MICO|nr:hypothetical protein [Microbacterium immunditiarum]NYE19046.1 hypothetical protein [Microbacterium immunditiarum]
MVTEHLISLALPYSTRRNDAFHVSVFVTPKLEGDAASEAGPGGTTLSDFAVFPHWAKAVRESLTVELRDDTGSIECRPVLDPVDPDAWDALFPGTTPVRANAVPPLADRRWRSFDAQLVHDTGKLVGLLTSVSSAVDPPEPGSHTLGQLLVGTLREFKILTGRTGIGEVDDERWTQIFDEEIGEGSDRKGPRVPRSSSAPTGMYGVLTSLHEVRRYYDRPESKTDYKAVPDAPPPDPLKPKEPEFHERVATVGDHPVLLRRLGLVIDLVVTDVNRLKKSQWLSAKLSIDVGGGTVVSAAPRVRCEAVADGALVTVPATPEWIKGAMALGDTDRFSVLDTDADGTAIKTEQYLRVLPRLMLRQANREPVDAASPGLRSQGFTIARKGQAKALFDRLGRQQQLEQQFGTPTPPRGGGMLLTSEDVARGIRVEVFDATDGEWRSVHERHTVAEIVELPKPLDLGDGHGFAQSAPAEESIPVGEPVEPPPVNVHEAVFGWEGWSLSVPKPGKRVRNELVTQPDGSQKLEEIVEPPPTAVPVDATNPVGFTHTIVPKSLPRLRYGRDYAFRAWLVDLAGNVRPPAPATSSGPSAPGTGGGPLTAGGAQPGRRVARPGAVGRLDAAAVSRLRAGLGRVEVPAELTDRLRKAVQTQVRKESARWETAAGLGRLGPVADALRDAAVAAVDAPQPVVPERPAPTLGRREQAALRSEIAKVLGRTDVEAALTGDALATATPSRASAVTRAMRSALTSARGAAFGVTAAIDTDTLLPAVAGQLGRATTILTPGGITPGFVLEALKTITAPRPFLRWEPVPPPTLVPRARYSEGESQRVVVIRSGVTQDPDTLDVAVTDPETYRSAVLADDPGSAFQAVGQRHLVPPKIGQLQAEHHGAFDALVGDGSAAGLKTALGVALRENGALTDIDVADLDNPGARIPVPGVSLVHDPGVDPGDLVTLPLPQGESPPAGQYVVHDVDDMVVPYLPDPLARGVSLVFPDATTNPALPSPFGIEGFTADYEIDARGWPVVHPYRLTLTDGPTPRAEVDDRVIDIALPAGTVQRFRLSSCLRAGALNVLGMWRSLPAVIQGLEIVREAARDGYLWSLTPKENVLLVHAVPRPVQAPRPVGVRSVRTASATFASFFGGVHVHGPSTEQLTIEASWTEPVDDLGLPMWEERASRGIAGTTRVTDHERLGVLFAQEFLPQGDLDWPADPAIRIHGTRHEFGDTKHRLVDYRLRASTRFREYFPPSLLTPAGGAAEFDDGSSVVSEVVRLSVPSSARPDPPVVHSVVPLFRWSHDDPDAATPPADDAGTVQAGQPIAERHTRRAGVRIYLERPWFSSGEGELLAVLLGTSPAAGPYSLYAQDPIWIGATWDNPHLLPLTLVDFWRATGVDDVWTPGEPVGAEAGLPLPTAAGGTKTYTASVLAYRPQYNPERRLWYVDVALNPGVVSWPFLRLAVARYQPESVPGLELSSPVSTDYVQVPPERTALVSRLDEHEVRVVVSGPVPVRRGPAHDPVAADLASIELGRLVVARLQKADPAMPGDLGWITVDSRRLVVANYQPEQHLIAWGTTLGSDDEEIPLRRPGPEASGWRVTVEEWERFPGDPAIGAPVGTAAPPPVWEQRLVFADEIYL